MWKYLQVGQDSDRVVILLLHFTDKADQLLLLVMLAVRKVKSKYIRPRKKELLNHLKSVARWAQRGDLLRGFAKAARVYFESNVGVGQCILGYRCLQLGLIRNSSLKRTNLIFL